MQISEEIFDPVIDVKIVFLEPLTGPIIELIEPVSTQSTAWKVLNKRSGPYHYAYEVEAINIHSARFRAEKIRELSPPMPAVAFQGRNVQFFGAPDGAVIELIETIQ